MEIPIVMAAFGTTTRARRTYDLLDAKIRETFPDHPVHWHLPPAWSGTESKTSKGTSISIRIRYCMSLTKPGMSGPWSNPCIWSAAMSSTVWWMK